MSAETSSPVMVAEAVAAPEIQATTDHAARKQLESTAIRATFWTAMDYGCAMVMRVVNSMVLTRLLMPEVFGLMTLVATLISGIGLLSDIGLGPNVIQSRRGDDPAFLNTAWTLQVLRGVGIFIIALLLAWPMSLFYRRHELLLLMPVLGLTVILGSFNSTNLLSMSRHMGVRRTFLVDFSGQVFGMVVTAACAWKFRSVWALVLGGILYAVYKMVLSHQKWAIPGITNRLCWDRESVHSLVHFGKWILLGTALYFFASQADRLIMGRLVTFSILGVYGIAYSVSDIPRAIINAFTSKVVFPFIAKMSHLPIHEFRKVYLHYRLRILLAGAALLTLMVYLGGPLVTRMYDSRYHAASWMVPVLALGLWHTLLYSTIQPMLFTLGKSKYTAVGNGAYCALILTAIPLGFHFFGIFGAVTAVAVGDFPLYCVYVTAASRERVSTWRQDLMMTGVFVVLLAVGFGVRRLIVG